MTSMEGREITVDEEAMTVKVDAAVKTIDLLNFLSNYVTPSSPTGYTLLAFPWYVFQSIAGAISTGTHGSSISHGSLSNQVVAMDVILANGTVMSVTPTINPFLFRALRISVGQLGIITSVTLSIVKEVPVRRTLRKLPSSSFLQLLDQVQEVYLSNQTVPKWVDETEFFWNVQSDEWMMVSFERSDDPAIHNSILQSFIPDVTTAYNTSALLDLMKPSQDSQLNKLPIKSDANFSLLNGANVSSASQSYIADLEAQMATDRSQQWPEGMLKCEDRIKGCEWPLPPPRAPNNFYALNSSALILMPASIAGVGIIAANATVEAKSSYLAEPASYDKFIKTTPFDQYEAAIPLSRVANCFRSLVEFVNLDSNSTDKGFRTAPLIRFIGPEDGLLSYTNDGARAFLNIEDYVFYNNGSQSINQKFHSVMGILRSPVCSGRLHWGKAGWPDAGCWRGEEEYPSTWCDFGCAKLALDPKGRFKDATRNSVWTWDVDLLAGCCTPDGFDDDKCKCTVTRATNVTCPPPPFYTNR